MRKEIACFIIGVLLIVWSAPPLYLIGQETRLQQTVNKQYNIENIYHPIDMTTDPFNELHYLQDGEFKPFPEMKREIFINERRVTDYSEYINAINLLEENELIRNISFYNTDIFHKRYIYWSSTS